MVAACATTVIKYTASGVFGATILGGKDTLKLAGEPFSITLYACESLVPTKKGSDYSAYYPIVMQATVKSALQTQPYNTSGKMTLVLTVPPVGLDSIQVEGPLSVLGSSVFIHGNLAFPTGTFTTTSIGPFANTTVTTSKSEFVYSITPPNWKANNAYAVNAKVLDSNGNQEQATTGGTSGSTAPAWNTTVNGTTNDGTVVWTNEGPLTPTTLPVIGSASGTVYTPAATKTSQQLHGNAVQVITVHGDGTQSIAPLAGAVDPAATFDRTQLKFYAAGVRDASEVHVQMGGQEVPVVSFGESGQYAGLDEVTVEVPRSMAGMGEVEVSLKADGQPAEPIHIRIQ
jgi:hypothetical protein